jgi:hypothetical protein
MITGEIKGPDKIWESFWTGGVSNLMTVNNLLIAVLRRLDETQLLEEKKK